MEKTMDEKDGYPSAETCVPTSPSLADVPASSDQPPTQVLPAVQDEMSLHASAPGAFRWQFVHGPAKWIQTHDESMLAKPNDCMSSRHRLQQAFLRFEDIDSGLVLVWICQTEFIWLPPTSETVGFNNRNLEVVLPTCHLLLAAHCCFMGLRMFWDAKVACPKKWMLFFAENSFKKHQPPTYTKQNLISRTPKVPTNQPTKKKSNQQKNKYRWNHKKNTNPLQPIGSHVFFENNHYISAYISTNTR